ncbi:MAG: hypothetical protein R8L07_11925 [Alphaproteobacteria bacterium]|nr:hypothetical protein [Alphaproteobacteria bacterium]
MQYRHINRSLLLIAGTAAVLFTAGCREEEQDRIKFFEPGVYQGQQDSALSEDTLDALRGRASQQKSP